MILKISQEVLKQFHANAIDAASVLQYCNNDFTEVLFPKCPPNKLQYIYHIKLTYLRPSDNWNFFWICSMVSFFCFSISVNLGVVAMVFVFCRVGVWADGVGIFFGSSVKIRPHLYFTGKWLKNLDNDISYWFNFYLPLTLGMILAWVSTKCANG